MTELELLIAEQKREMARGSRQPVIGAYLYEALGRPSSTRRHRTLACRIHALREQHRARNGHLWCSACQRERRAIFKQLHERKVEAPYIPLEAPGVRLLGMIG